MTTVPRVADVIAATLAAAGIRHAFGMPGGEVIAFVDALERAGVRFVLCRDETAAAIAAAGAAVISGAPGLVVTTLGPGVARAVNGLADAMQERAPVLIVSGVVERRLRARYTHQVIDHPALLRAVVKASYEVDADDPGSIVTRAMTLALRAPMGPVHLDLAPDTAAASSERVAASAARPVRPGFSPDAAALSPVLDRLATARRPLIVAGHEVARAGADVTRLAETMGAPVVTTYKAKGVVREDHPLALGAAGLSPLADRLLAPVVGRADAVILLGYDPIEMRAGWLDPFDRDAFCLEISQERPDHAMHRVDARLELHPKQGTEALLGQLRPAEGWPVGDIEVVRASLHAAFAPRAAWGPDRVFAVLQEMVPQTAIVTVDSGAHRILFSQMWRAMRPLSVLQSAGWCTMGAAMPLALGAALSAGDVSVVAVVGDGCFELTLAELATLRDAGVGVTVVVLQDESLALIALKQGQSGLPLRGVALGRTDYVRVAAGFGCRAVCAPSAPTLRQALDAALMSPGLDVIVCPIDPADYVDRF